MKSRRPCSDDRINALIDDEIDTRERAEFMQAVHEDSDLARRVCAAMQVKEAVRLAYRQPEKLRANGMPDKPQGRFRVPLQAVAAILIFALGTATGVVMKSQRANETVPAGNAHASSGTHAQELKRVVIHIGTDNQERVAQALTEAEELLYRFRDQPEQVQVEIVANTTGLSLLRVDTSPFPERIRRLAQRYDNISFLACSRTIEKLQVRGIDVHLLPEARVIPGALEEIVDRMQSGWAYIRA